MYVAKSTRSTFDLNLTHSPVRSNKGPIPTPSNHASRPSFDTLADMINDTLEESPQSHAEAKKHVGLVLFSLSRNSRSSHPGQALIRDGYRCVVTKSYDIASVMKIRELKQTVDSDPSAQGDSTYCAHIFSESTNSNIEPGSDKVHPHFNFFAFCLTNNDCLCIA